MYAKIKNKPWSSKAIQADGKRQTEETKGQCEPHSYQENKEAEEGASPVGID